MTHDDLAGLMPIYALDALASEERRQVRLHLEHCPDCRETLASFQQTSGDLSLIAEPAAPPPALRGRLLAALPAQDQTTQPEASQPAPSLRLAARPSASPDPASQAPQTVARRRLGWQKVAALVAVAALLALGAVTVNQARQLHTARNQVAEQRSLLNAIANPNLASVALAGAGNAGTGSGRIVLTTPTQAVLVAAGLPKPSGSQVYEVWLITNNHPAPLAGFQPDPSGLTLVAMPPGPMPASPKVAVTLEPRANDQTPQGPKVLQSA